MRALIHNLRTPTVLMANIKQATEAIGVVVANEFSGTPDETWVQLSPFGKFPNKQGLQVFEPNDAHVICNEFSSLAALPQRALGIPFYIGHPDHPAFADRYRDTRAYGRIKELQVRHDATCRDCHEFANEEADAPCAKHGLFGRTRWSEDGKNLIANESFHGHSVTWRLKMVNGAYHPFSLKSVGFTNEPNIQVAPILAANEIEMDLLSRRFSAMSVMRGITMSNAKSKVKGYRRVSKTGKVVFVKEHERDRDEMIKDAEDDLQSSGIKDASASEIKQHLKDNYGVDVSQEVIKQRIARLAKLRRKK